MRILRDKQENVFTVRGVKTHLDEKEKASFERGAIEGDPLSFGWQPMSWKEKKMARAILRHDFVENPDYFFHPKGEKGYAIHGGKSPYIESLHWGYKHGPGAAHWVKDSEIYPYEGNLHMVDYRTGNQYILDLKSEQKLIIGSPDPTLGNLLRGGLYAAIRRYLRE